MNLTKGSKIVQPEKVAAASGNVLLKGEFAVDEETGDLHLIVPYSAAIKASKSSKGNAGFMIAADGNVDLPGWGSVGASKGTIWVGLQSVGTGAFTRGADGAAKPTAPKK